MNDIRNIKEKYALNTQRYTIKKGITIVDADDGRFVFKRNSGNDVENLYKYLNSRNFNYYAPLIRSDDNYNIYNYIDEVDTPLEQKALDLMFILSLLHNKTTFYKEVDIDNYKKIYEDITDKINYYNSYYTDMINKIETKIYMSPTEYLIARNINKIYASITFCKQELNSWYQLIKGKHKQRLVTLHNNLELDHLIEGNEIYLVSWDKYKVDMPIYDIYTLYQKHYFDLDFNELLKVYEDKYPLLEEEKQLLFILIALPHKIDLTTDQYQNCKIVNNYFDYIFKTEELISNYKTHDETDEAT